MASFGRILWRWTAGVFAVLAIGLALLFGVFRIAVSHAPEYRQPIEARASEVIGLPVSIGVMLIALALSVVLNLLGLVGVGLERRCLGLHASLLHRAPASSRSA